MFNDYGGCAPSSDQVEAKWKGSHNMRLTDSLVSVCNVREVQYSENCVCERLSLVIVYINDICERNVIKGRINSVS